MKKELDEKLCEDFTLMFSDRHEPMEFTAMCWGFDCDDGWEPLIRDAASKIEPILRDWVEKFPDEDHPRASQVKEKFGGLRIYMSKYNDEISSIIDEIEDKSYSTCEICGKEGKLRSRAWLKTLCDNHDEER